MPRKRKDNLDLQMRRKRLRVLQHEVAERLGLARDADVSEFELGKRATLPHGKGRADYERVLDQLEAERTSAA